MANLTGKHYVRVSMFFNEALCGYSNDVLEKPLSFVFIYTIDNYSFDSTYAYRSFDNKYVIIFT